MSVDYYKCFSEPNALDKYIRESPENFALFNNLSIMLAKAIKQFVTRKTPYYLMNSEGTVNIRRTIARSCRYGGLPLEIKFKERSRKHEIMLVIDFSDSMRCWGEWFIWAPIVATAMYRILSDEMDTYIFCNNHKLVNFNKFMGTPERFIREMWSIKEADFSREKSVASDSVGEHPMDILFSELSETKYSTYTHVILMSDLIFYQMVEADLDRGIRQHVVNLAEKTLSKALPVIKRVRSFLILDPCPTNDEERIDEGGWSFVYGYELGDYLMTYAKWDKKQSRIQYNVAEYPETSFGIQPSRVESVQLKYENEIIGGYYTLWQSMTKHGAHHHIIRTPEDVASSILRIT